LSVTDNSCIKSEHTVLEGTKQNRDQALSLPIYKKVHFGLPENKYNLP